MNSETHENDGVRQCFWRDGMLVVVTARGERVLDSTTGVKALKANRFTDSEGSFVLFSPDSPRRMVLIQEAVSVLRD